MKAVLAYHHRLQGSQSQPLCTQGSPLTSLISLLPLVPRESLYSDSTRVWASLSLLTSLSAWPQPPIVNPSRPWMEVDRRSKTLDGLDERSRARGHRVGRGEEWRLRLEVAWRQRERLTFDFRPHFHSLPYNRTQSFWYTTYRLAQI